MAIFGLEYLEENLIINAKDIYYNKDKFDNGDINLCFITGHSGSGKSTMAHSSESETVEVYELDDLHTIKDRFTMDNLKEYGDLIYSFFNGSGKRFYVTNQELIDNKVPGSEYEDKMYPEFVHYAMKYANSHKDKKYIIEGIWIFETGETGKDYFEPSEFDNYAFYIKGTSALISKYRAAKRDCKDAGDKKEQRKAFRKNFIKNDLKWIFFNEKQLNKFRRYFRNKMKEE